MSLPGLGQPFVVGSLVTPHGEIPRVSSELSWSDRWGSIKARWGVGRMHYEVDPGLYALGMPDETSPVMVTANYKMSFDRLREALPGLKAWILVLDTQGINVWCAAGKRTFGTGELVRRIEVCGLSDIVSHRELILPQLAGPGVAAHVVRRLSGFKVIYGPIRAMDIPAFLAAGRKATAEMRRKTFTTHERAVLIPVELVSALKWALLICPVLFILGGLGGAEGFLANAMNHGLFAVSSFLVAVFAGAVMTPLLLPWLPGRAFTLKGLSMGLISAVVISVLRAGSAPGWAGGIEIAAWCFLVCAVAGYLGMNFTGSSTYTSLSGVKKEMRWAVPMEIVAGGLGFILWLGTIALA